MAEGKDRLAAALAKRGRTVPATSGDRATPARPQGSGRRSGRGKGKGTPNSGDPRHFWAAASPGDLDPLVQAFSHQEGALSFHAGEARVPCVLVPGDCRTTLSAGPEAWVDAIICDPGVGALADVDGWQRQVPGPLYWSALLRAAKPGAHMAIFAGRKTFHRVVTYAEDAGWEMRDTLMWVYPKGMPMALDVGQAVDRKMGGDGEAYFRTMGSLTDTQREAWLASRPGNPWYGWGTELRPTWEPIVLLRKPISEGSVADNHLRWGTGALNIDATRIESGSRDAIATHIPDGQGAAHGQALMKHQAVVGETTLGRWPSDALFSHAYGCGEDGCVEGCPVGILDTQDPERRQPPSRFFFCPKASRAERDVGLGHKGNTHKAVKPLAVTDWLVKLLVPPGGVVLDPFCGTASTGLSVSRLAPPSHPGLFVGCDLELGWLELGRQRLLSVGELGS